MNRKLYQRKLHIGTGKDVQHHLSLWKCKLKPYYTPIRTANIKKTKKKKILTNTKCGQGTATLIHCWWEFKMRQPLWKIIWQFLKKLNIHLPCDPATSFLGIYPRSKNTCPCKDLYIIAHRSFIYIVKN